MAYRDPENDTSLNQSLLRNMIPKRKPARPGNRMPLESLAPKYHREHHELYLDLLERALKHPSTRNIALTGSYGSGKSSVLHELSRKKRKHKVIELSLSTLDPNLISENHSENEVEAEISNRIQKELVKQILYQLPPRRTPHSRFRRASKPSILGGLQVAAATAGLVFLTYVVAVLAGWHTDFVQLVEQANWNVPLFWLALISVPVILALFVWSFTAGRLTFKAGVNASALSVSLEPESSSYFDQYLDEIMYFFQVSKCEIVLIEDVDRFDDPIVFDTLRALNTLVNNSGQVNRRVVFVYAIRDSVLDKIGSKPDQPQSNNQKSHPPQPEGNTQTIDKGQAVEKRARANRTKYFDIIIPIVPFVTTTNARDLLMLAMGSHVATRPGAEGLSPSLIRLVARYVADMRTIQSIRNEFEVYRDRLITSAETPMPGISDDVVFSLVLLRATHPETYEEIRLSTSALDTLVERWSDLIEAQIADRTEDLIDLRTQLENNRARVSRAKKAGERLSSLRPRLSLLNANFGSAEVSFHGPLKEEDLANPDGWQQIAEGEALRVVVQEKQYPRKSITLQLEREMLEDLIGISIAPQAWQQADLKDLENDIEATEAEIRFLRHHTWTELHARDDLSVQAEPNEKATTEEKINFEGLVDTYAPSPLVQDLIAHGYLPRHFARYSSRFYGAVVSANATEYISRAIEPGAPIMEFELTDADIHQILLEQNATIDYADLFDDPSIYNLDLVSYLLSHRPEAAKRVAKHLATRWEALEKAFTLRFFQRQSDKQSRRLATLMTEWWEQALMFTVVEANLTDGTRLHLLNSVLGAVNSRETRYDLDPEVGVYLSENYEKLDNVVRPRDRQLADDIMRLIDLAGGEIRDLTFLNEISLDAAMEMSTYPVTSTNLQVLRDLDDIALDVLFEDSAKRTIYRHFVANLRDYLDAVTQLEPAGEPISNPANFVPILNDIAGSASPELLFRFVAEVRTDSHILRIEEVDSSAWPALLDHDYIAPTFSNVSRYIDKYGIDQYLSQFLNLHKTISDVDEAEVSERLEIAIQILASRHLIADPEIRVTLAESLEPGFIPISQLKAEDANLVGRMLQADLLQDTADIFSSDILKDWEDFESAVAASREFGDFVVADILPIHQVGPLLRSRKIPEKIKAEVIAKLDELLSDRAKAHANDIVQTLINRNEKLGFSHLEALCRAGASQDLLVKLLVAQDRALSIGELRDILKQMEGDYRRVSEGGSGVVRFEVDEDHQILLKRLEGITHTGAEIGTTKQHGTKLRANLKRP